MKTQKNDGAVTSSTNPFLSENPMSILSKPFTPRDPFAPRSSAVPEGAPEGSYTYELVPSGPAVTAEECERAAASVEIVIRWGESVLHVAHLTPPRSFQVGEASGKDAPCDFFLPEEKLGAARLPLLVVGEDRRASVVIPAHATGSITFAGEAAISVADAIASGKAVPSTSLASAHQIALLPGAKAELDLGGIRVAVSAVNAGRAVAGRFQLDARSLPYQGLSLLLHAGVLAATALFMPHLAMASDGEGMSEDQRYLLATKLEQIAERNATPVTTEGQQGDPSAPAKADASPHAGPTSTHASARDVGAGPRENRGAPMSRAEAIRQAGTFGMIELVQNLASSDPGATATPWAVADARGNLPGGSANLWGQTLDDVSGGDVIGLSGIGDVGGGRFTGVLLGGVGTIGGATGDASTLGGPGGRPRLHGEHKVGSPSIMRVGTTSVDGVIPPELIQRIVRQNFGRFKLCYENGLRNNPGLAGRVTVRFAINHDGSVVSAANGGSDLPDSSVVSCVTSAFYGLSFPPPSSGIVKVTYPIVFSPAN